MPETDQRREQEVGCDKAEVSDAELGKTVYPAF